MAKKSKKKAAKTAKKKAKKYVYFFGDGKADARGTMKDLLGGKGAGLAEMTNLKIPVPAGFTITTEACNEYFRAGKKYPSGLWEEVLENLKKVEGLKKIAKNLGISLSQLAIAWVLRRPEMTAAIVGARKPGQILETAKAGDITLEADVIEAIEGI